MEGSGRCETSRPPATTLLHVGDRACVAAPPKVRSARLSSIFSSQHMFSSLLMEPVVLRLMTEGLLGEAVNFGSVSHEAADREMFRRVNSDTTVFGSHGPALQYCNAWMLWLGPAALNFRHSSWHCSIYRFARRTLDVKFGAQLASLESRSQERFSAIFRAHSNHFRLQHQVSGLHVLLTTDCCP